MGGLGKRRIAGITVLLGVPLLLLTSTAVGQEVAIKIPLSTIVRGAEGSQHLLAHVEVPVGEIGRECSLSAVVHNQESVHPGNDLVVVSGGGQLVLEDVEGVAGGETNTEGTIILGSDITVTLVMGSDGVFSAGMAVNVICPVATTTTPPTTVEDSSTTSEEPSSTVTTVPETTTTSEIAGTSSSSTTPPTTVLASSTSTTQPKVTTASTLPFTGADSKALARVGVVALVVGAGLVLVSGLASREEQG